MLDTKALAAATAAIVREHVDAATAPLLVRIAELEKRAPERGEQGPAGAPGANGADGKDMDPDAVAALVDEAVARAVGALPAPERGETGEAGPRGEKGAEGTKGADGKDGAGIADLLIDRDGGLVATFTDGRIKSLGNVIGKDGTPGQDGRNGRDGFSLEDFEAKVLEDGRTIRFAMTAGDVQHAYQLSFPVVIDRGVYREGQTYQPGDGVTWAGSYWIAQKETTAKPDSGDGFRLAVKRGRDGKDKA